MREPDSDVAVDRDAEDDSLKEACGVFGVYAPGQPVAHLTYLGLYALQHRGQESAGMAVSDGEQVMVVKDMGLVSHVFNERTLAPLTGHLAIGHTRYSTTGVSTWRNAQPVYRGVGNTHFALGHNGNLVNTEELAEEAGMLPGTVASDSDLVAELVAMELEQADAAAEAAAVESGTEIAVPADQSDHAIAQASFDAAVAAVLPRLQGAFSFIFMDDDRIIGVRDPNGFRPLCLGRLDGGGWVLASESPALDVVGAHFVREVDPGEMVIIDGEGVRSLNPFPPERLDPKLCIFEFVYFARPDARLYGRSVHHARVRQGELLAAQAPVEADMVMGVPESGLPAAEGYARASGIPYGQGLVKNRYIGRTFIAPSQALRAQAVRMKLNPLRENLVDKRVVVVDDSIVRGTTQKQLVKMLRESGVKEVHLRITSPPVKWSCFFGIDTGRRSDLLAHNLTVDDIRDYLNVDTLAYITLDHLISSTGTSGAGFCHACFTGEYPIEVPVSLSKSMLDGGDQTAHGCAPTAAPAMLGNTGLFSTQLPADEARQR
ncbi:MAG: amidophosphoribosyltransferase [Aquihabitans sp.]